MGILGYFVRYVALPSIFPAVILFSASAMAGSPKLIEASRAQEIVSLRRHDDDIKREVELHMELDHPNIVKV